MKSLLQYITEELKTYRVTNLEVPFICMPDQEYIKFHVPETYSEDDFQIYLQDMYLNDLPASDDKMEEFFGKNANNIYDVLFEYETYEKGVEGGDCVEWDNNLDNKHNPDNKNEEFIYIQIKGLKYIIKFDKFDMKIEYESEVKSTLEQIFTNCETNVNNKWPLELKLDMKNIKYNE